MKSLFKTVLRMVLPKRYALFKTFVIIFLVLSLTACGGEATGQDISIKLPELPVREKNNQFSPKISEVAPPEVIQELSQSLELYQPQIKILNPQPDEILEENKLQARFQVKDLPIFKDERYSLGSHLDVILDNQPKIKIYDLNQPLELSNLSAGTHTLRVFASSAWEESFKNEGAYAQTTFHVFTKSDDNNPDSNLPILTYNSPQGSYSAEPILLDFYLTNAPLHILAKDNPDNPVSDWRIRCTINDESFILDRWQSSYLKGFNVGKNWVKLEFLDNQGNPVKNVFNSTLKVINYEPESEDILAKATKGELSAEDLQGIVDPNYAIKIPAEQTPPIKIEEKLDKGGFFNRFKRGKEDKTSTPQPTLESKPDVIKTPKLKTPESEIIKPEDKLEQTLPEVIEAPQTGTNSEKTTPEIIEQSQPETVEPEIIKTEDKLEETVPEVIEIPQPKTKLEDVAEPKPEAKKSKLDGLLNKFQRNKEDKMTIPQPTVEVTPEIIETPKAEVELEETNPEVIERPTLEIQSTPEIVEPLENQTPESEIEKTPETKQSATEKLKQYFKLPRRETPEVKPEVIETSEPEINLEERIEEIIPEMDRLKTESLVEQEEDNVIP